MNELLIVKWCECVLWVSPVNFHNALHTFTQLLHPNQTVIFLHALQKLRKLEWKKETLRPTKTEMESLHWHGLKSHNLWTVSTFL